MHIARVRVCLAHVDLEGPVQHAVDTEDELEGSVRPAKEGGTELEAEAEEGELEEGPGGRHGAGGGAWRATRSWRRGLEGDTELEEGPGGRHGAGGGRVG